MTNTELYFHERDYNDEFVRRDGKSSQELTTKRQNNLSLKRQC
jgi:hypothetical protein